MSGPFKMKGSSFYGHGNSSPAKQDYAQYAGMIEPIMEMMGGGEKEPKTKQETEKLSEKFDSDDKGGLSGTGLKYASPAKDKPTKQELIDAANNPNHPNSEKNMGKDAYYAWKAGGTIKEEPKNTGLTHGTGGTLVDEKGNVDEEASKENIEHLKT